MTWLSLHNITLQGYPVMFSLNRVPAEINKKKDEVLSLKLERKQTRYFVDQVHFIPEAKLHTS